MLNSNCPSYSTLTRSTESSNATKESFYMNRHMCSSQNSDRKIKSYLYHIAERFDVVLKKGNQGFGLTLVDDMFIENIKLLKVKAIYKDGPAGKCGIIQPGDILSAFNQIDIIGVQPDEVIKMFKLVKEKESIVLTVWKIIQASRMRPHHNQNYEIINFYLQKSEGGFGFILGNCKDEHQVAKVNGTGDVQLLLKTNDKITNIGRVRIDHFPHDQVVTLLKKFPRNHFLHFTVVRDTTNLIRSISNDSFQNMDYSMNSSIYSKISKNIDPLFYSQLPGIGISGPCNTPDFIPATHFLSLNRQDSSKLFQPENCKTLRQIPSSYSTPSANLIPDVSQQPDFIPDTFYESIKTNTIKYSQPPETVSVQLTRSPTKGFGFRLMGGAEEGCQVYIGAIIPNGSVDQCGLIHCGDVITEINNTSTEKKTHSEVVTLLDEAAKSANGKLNITVRKSRRESHSGMHGSLKIDRDCRNVLLTRSSDEEFGFVIVSAVNPTEPCGIGRINPGSVAEKCRELHLGDRILAVNGSSTEGLHYKDVIKIIKHGDLNIELTIRDGDINRLKTIKYELPRHDSPDLQFTETSETFSDLPTQPVSIMKPISQFDKQTLRTLQRTPDEALDAIDKQTQVPIMQSIKAGDFQSSNDPLSLLVQRR